MSESGQRQRVIRGLKGLDPKAVENPIGPGTPDVNYIEGWIELKWVRRWPAREETIVRIDHFTRGQRRWLRNRYNLGGHAWLLLQCGREWLLFHGLNAHDYVGLVTREELYTRCCARWAQGLKNEELKACLTADWGNWDGSPVVSGS